MTDVHLNDMLAKALDAFAMRSYNTSIELCRKALLLVDNEASGIQARQMRVKILLLLAEVHEVKGQWVDSLLYLDGILQISVGLNDPKLGIEALIHAGKIISKKGNWKDALKKFEKAESLAKKQGSHKLYGRALIGKGTIFWRKGSYSEAVKEAEQAAKIGRSLLDDSLVGGAEALIASIRFDQGNYKASVEANMRAFEAFNRVKDAYEMARVLNNTGETYKVLGEYEKAITHFERCLKVAKESDNKRNQGYALMNIADCRVRKGETAEAKAAASKAEVIFTSLEDKYAHACMAMIWGMLHASQNNQAKAISSFEKAIDLMNTMNIPYDTGITLFEYGRALIKFNQHEKAVTHLKKAARLLGDAGAIPMKIKVEKTIADIQQLEK